MKLIMCSICMDIVCLRTEKTRSCICGESKGKYINNRMAVVTGACVSIGMDSNELEPISYRLLKDKKDGYVVTRKQAIHRYKLKCWLRDNSSEMNPHTKEVSLEVYNEFYED